MKAKGLGKRLLSWLMVMAMVFSVLHITAPMAVKAEDGVHGITLGIPKWSSGRTTYQFPQVEVTMSEGVDKQKVFCLSVDNDGYFVADFDDIHTTVDISGVTSAGKYVDNVSTTSPISSSTQLISLTVLGDIKDDDIKKFISDIVFYRNGVTTTSEQHVSVVSSSFDVRDSGATALAIDGKIHFYKYVDWDSDVIQEYKVSEGKKKVSVSKSAVYNDESNWTWYKAYELAKKETMNGLKGYLATITSDEEQFFIYNKLGVPIEDVNKDKGYSGGVGAWIGGARTFKKSDTPNGYTGYEANFEFDADTITQIAPGTVKDNSGGTNAVNWYWMCGPEKGTAFYETGADGRVNSGASTINSSNYHKWTSGEPNNTGSLEGDYAKYPYNQEYALQYGFRDDGAWNDWYPEHSEKTANSFQACIGYIVEFSPYDINGDGNLDDPGEKYTTPVENDMTIITAQPHIVDAKLYKTTFKLGEAIEVTSVLGDDTVDADGKPADELTTDNKVPVYQWEVFDEVAGAWKNAGGAGSNTRSYTPDEYDVGRKLRVHITATTNDTDNPKKYAGDIYLDATGSDDQSNKVKGTTVETNGANVTGNDFMISKSSLPVNSNDVINTYSKAKATTDGVTSTPVSTIADSELDTLKNTKAGSSAEITLVNSKYTGVKTKVTANVFDNATPPATDLQGKLSQIGSNNFSVAKGSGDRNLEQIIKNGNVTVMTDGEKAERSYTDYSIPQSDIDGLNEKIQNGSDGDTYDVHVTDSITGFTTTITVTILGKDKAALDNAKLDPFKGKDENGNWTHYNGGDTITVSEVGLDDNTTVFTGDKLTDGSFTYQWQYSPDGAKGTWEKIPGATGITLSADDTMKYARNKVQVIITPTDQFEYNKTKVVRLYVDGDGYSRDENKTDTEGNPIDYNTGGTFIDLFTIDGSDFIVTVAEAKAMGTSAAAAASGVKTEMVNTATSKDVAATPTSDVAAGLNKVENPCHVPVTFQAVNGTVSARDKDSSDQLNAIGKTVTAYVTDKAKKDTGSDGKTVSIGANNFDISVDDVKKALAGDDTILKELSSVVAISDGANVPTVSITVSDKSQLKDVPGKYPVTFTYNGVSVTVDATVKSSGNSDSVNDNDNNKDNKTDEVIAGNDFTVAGGSTPLTPADIIDKGNVDAVDGNGTPIVLPPDSSVNKDDLDKLNEVIKDGKKGTYPVEVTTPNGTKVTVNVTVTDKNDDTKTDNTTKTDETIAANNFKIGINDYDRIFGDSSKKTNVTKLSNAKAYDTVLKTPVEITSIDTSQVANAAGTYPITLTTAKGTSTTINVTIDGDWDTIGDIDKASQANAQDETVNNDSAKKITPVGISVSPADIVYEKTNPQDKTEPIDSSKQVPPTGALKVDGVNVDKYSVSADGGTLIISKDYLDTLPKGSYQAVVTYADGTEQKFTITVVDYDEATIVKNPPLFSMYKEIVLKKKNTFTVNLQGITKYAVVNASITGKGKNAKKVVAIKQKANGDVVITPKKVGKSQVTCTIIQNGAEYKVVVDIKVLKQYKGTSKNYNLKPKGLVKTSGELPEFNVYKRIVKGKNTKIKFTKVATDAKVKFYVANKKEAKSLKIGKVKRKGTTATCTIKGKKKGWVHLTAEITQNGKTYYTRLLVRIDDGTWSKKQIKKYLK